MKTEKEIKTIIYQYIIDNKGSCTSIDDIPELKNTDGTICSYCGIYKEPPGGGVGLRCSQRNCEWKTGYCKEYFTKEILKLI